MADIHPTAVVDANAELADNVKIGPLCVIGPNVKIGPDCELVAQIHITGHTTLGRKNTIYPFASMGTPPQDYDFNGEVSYLKIGDGNTFREGFTANPGTKPGTETVIGNNCYFMANSHVAHNCVIGDNVIMANDALPAGYAEIGDRAILSGLTAVHQFCRVGRLAMIGGCCAISKDLPPYMMCFTKNNRVSGLNLIGMKRSGIPAESIKAMKQVYRIFFRSALTPKLAMEKIEAEVPITPEVEEFMDFVKTTKRGILMGPAPRGGAETD